MTKQQLQEWIDHGRELEFTYQGKDYSITYYNDPNKKDYISFCEFYQDTLDVFSVDLLWNSSYHDIAFSTIWLSLAEEDITVF